MSEKTLPEKPVAFNETLAENEVRILAPDFTLKQKIGGDAALEEIFSPENLARAQSVIDSHKNSFVEWVMHDIDTLEEAYEYAHAQLPKSDVHIRKIARAALVIKSQAGTFGYFLGTHIAKSLDNYCTKHFKPTESHLQVVRQHINCLSLIFRKNIAGDGGKIGKEIADMMARLVSKFD